MNKEKKYILSNIEDKMNNFHNDYDCVIYSATYCPYSKRAKKKLCEKYNNIKIIEVNKDHQGDNYKTILINKYNHTTVPAIFIHNKFIGGFDDLE